MIEIEGPIPLLQLVAGSGSKVRELRTSNPELRFARDEAGFARIDLVGRGRDQQLVASLFSTRHVPPFPAPRPRLIAQFAVGRDGNGKDLLASPPVFPLPSGERVHARP